jgi:glycosyltransferase involved in cell wall biosynthesis
MAAKQCRIGNLLMVANFPSDTGYAWWLMEHFWRSMAEQFERHGKMSFLAYPKITSLSEAINIKAIEPVELVLPWRSPGQAWSAVKFLRKNNITSIYFTDKKYFDFKYFIMRLIGVKHIIVHDHTPGDRLPVGGFRGAIKYLINNIPWFTADRILCVSKHMQQRNIATTKVPARKCIVIQNGIEPIKCKNTYKQKILNELKLPTNSILITTTGRANPYKRFDFIIDSASELRKQSPESGAIFLLVGDGPAMADLRQQVHDYKLEKSVLLLGFRTDVREILCASDIAFHAALGEGFSLSIIEYMSAGLPVLAPDITSVSQAIIHNKTGLIYRKDDPMVAATFITELISNEKLRHTMGRAAKNEADDKYSLEQCTRSFLTTIKKVYQLESE